jgi:hypothetical protein
MTEARTLILRLRNDAPTRDMCLEAADMIEQLSRAQRRLPHAQTVTLGEPSALWLPIGDDFAEPNMETQKPEEPGECITDLIEDLIADARRHDCEHGREE